MTDDIDMTAFLASDSTSEVPVVATGKASKKNKKKRSSPYSKPGDEEMADMRKRAKSMCNSYEQYRSISKYTKDRLKDWLQQKDFDSDAQLRESVFSFAHKAYAIAFDFITKGDGHVRERLESDLSLRTAIEDEGRDIVKWLSNKSKIAFLTASDTFEGKIEQRKQIKLNPPPTIEELPDNVHLDQFPTAEDHQNHNETAVDAGDLFRNIEADDNATEQVLPMSEGEKEVQTATQAVPGDHQGETPSDTHLWTEGIGQDGADGEAVEIE